MPPVLANLRSRLLDAFDTTGARLACVVAGVTGLVVLAGSAISYWNARDIYRQKEIAALELAAADESQRIADSLESFSRAIANLAADESVASAVIDSEGRSRHLAPVLRLVQTTLVRQFAGQDRNLRTGDPTVAVLDYRGRWLLGSPGASAEEFTDPAWLRNLVKGEVRVRLDPSRNTFYVAHPVIFAGTGLAEGVLVGTLPLRSGITDTRRSARWVESIGRAADAAALGSNREYLSASRPLPLERPLDNLGLRVTLGVRESTLATEALALLWPYLLVAIAGVIAAIAAGIALGRRLAGPLMRIAQTAQARQQAGDESAPSFALSAAGGTREVRLLARRLDEALGAIAESGAQAHLVKSALDAASDGVVIVSAREADMPLIYVNRAFEQITGYGAPEVLGRNCRFLHDPDPAQATLAPLREAIRREQPCRVVLRNWRKDGNLFWNELSIAPVRDSRGTLTHFVGIQKDVSERVRAEEHLRASQKLESLGQLTGGLAHDFNNLLGIIIGNLDLLTELLPEGSAARGRSDTALKAALRGADVTRSLLAVARRQRLDPQEIDLNDRLREMLPLVSNTVGRRVEVFAELGDGALPSRVDIGGLDAALLNLAINARDAMSETGGKLRIRTRELRLDGTAAIPELADLAEGRYACIDVIDDGCGMPDEVRARAFEPFYTTKAVGHGTGLGLSMVYGFARQSGGTALLRSTPGEGTTVSIVLPSSAEVPR